MAEKAIHNFATLHPCEYVQSSIEILGASDATESIIKTIVVYMKKTLPLGKNKLRLVL